ncbi:MAG TPA: hypothetical protein VK094_06880 [Pseudogracilibacillus sp.]|nr:hypothetical protein [Pseudogracilibacillus sp.]
MIEDLQYANELLQANRVEEALKLLEDKIQLADLEEQFVIGELYFEWGFFDEALKVFQKIEEVLPNEGQIKLFIASIYIELEMDSEAIETLSQIEASDDFYLQALMQLADLYESQGLFEVAELKLREAKSLSKDEIIIDFALGELLFSIGEYNKAIIHYEIVLKETDFIMEVNINERLAESLAMISNYEEALKYYQEVEDKDADTLFKYGFIASQVNRNDIAINAWKELIEQDKDYHSVYVELAKVYLKEEMKQEAYEVIKEGLKIDEFNQELYFMAGKLANEFGDFEESESYIKEAIILDNDYKAAVIFLINILKDEHRLEEVIDLITEVKRLGAEDPEYDWELARAYNENEEFEKAYEYYKLASEHLQTDSIFLKEFGYFLVEDSKIPEAIDTFKKYLEIDPQDNEIIAFLNRLQV